MRTRLLTGSYILAAVLIMVMLVQNAGGCSHDRQSGSDPGSSSAATGATTGPATNDAESDTTAAAPGSTAAGALDRALAGTVERDVTYGDASGVALKMDIYYPQVIKGPAPVIMYVHGGGWTQGDKTNATLTRAAPALTAAGFLVVSVNYRLAPDYKFPVQIEDVKCAVRYLKANAARYGLDPARIGAWGGSAGGHLVSLLGVTDGSEGLEGNGGNPQKSSRVAAVVDMFGPSDLTQVFNGGARGTTLGTQVFGASDAGADVLKAASPVTYISGDDPPFLILQGEKDELVPPWQSQELYDRLTAAGVPATLVMVKNAGHSFTPTGGRISPSLPEISGMIQDFFRKELGANT